MFEQDAITKFQLFAIDRQTSEKFKVCGMAGRFWLMPVGQLTCTTVEVSRETACSIMERMRRTATVLIIDDRDAHLSRPGTSFDYRMLAT